MRYTDILLEYNRDQTVKNYGEKILAVAIKDRTVPWLDIFGNGQPEVRKAHELLRTPEGQQTALNYIMGVIEQSDPTKNKNYAQAITRLYSLGETLLEDVGATLSQYLVKFDKLKNKKKIPAPYNDFMRYKSLNDFMSYVETLPDPDSEIEQQKVADIQLPPHDTWRYVYGRMDESGRITSDVLVIQPLDKYAGYWWAKEYPKKGVTNRWCTAWEDSNSRFDYYSKQGPLYIIIPARRGFDDEKFQFHFETKQFMDYQDHQIGDSGMEALVQRFPALTEVFKNQAAKYSILPLMSEEYKKAVRDYAKPASVELDQLITKYQDRIAEFGFGSLTDYGIDLDDRTKQELLPLIKDYLDQCKAALVSKNGVWKQIVTKLGTERNEDKLEVILNTDPTLKSVMEDSEAGKIVADIVNSNSDISKRIDATHLQDLILRDPLFRFVMRQIPKLYATLLNDLAPGTVNESDEDEETSDEGFFVCIGSEDDGGFVGMVHKENNRWREVAVSGKAPYNWGGSYMSYLTPGDIMQHIRNDYSRGHDVKGPFSDEHQAMEYAYHQYGLGDEEDISEEWSQKYKSSINCSHPKGFSQRAHCAGKKKHNESTEMEMTCPDCGVSESYSSKQEVIDHFVKQGKTAAQGAAAWERGWRGNDKKKPNPFDPNYKFKPVDNKRYGEVDEANKPDEDEDDGLIAGKYTPDEFDAMVSRVGQLAKAHEKRSDPGDISKLAARLAGIEGKK